MILVFLRIVVVVGEEVARVEASAEPRQLVVVELVGGSDQLLASGALVGRDVGLRRPSRSRRRRARRAARVEADGGTFGWNATDPGRAAPRALARAAVVSSRMDPDAVEIRVLGCLIEKQRTTPDAYPLSLNALRLACNQSTNRDPVVDYDEDAIRDALQHLYRRGWTRLDERPRQSRRQVPPPARRGARPRDDDEIAILAVLMLRGPRDARRAEAARRAAAPLRRPRRRPRDARGADRQRPRRAARAAPGAEGGALPAAARRRGAAGGRERPAPSYAPPPAAPATRAAPAARGPAPAPAGPDPATSARIDELERKVAERLERELELAALREALGA